MGKQNKGMKLMSGIFFLQVYFNHIPTFIITTSQMYAHSSMQQHYTLCFLENKETF